MPVNDRMSYSPYDAFEICATKRFLFVESHVTRIEPGLVMHSEKFLDAAILQAIRELGFSIVVNPDIFTNPRGSFHRDNGLSLAW